MKIEELLRSLGLNKYESNSYKILLENGTMKAGEISKKGQIPFGKIYETLEKMRTKGLIEVVEIRPKKYRIRDPKIAFKEILYYKEKNYEEELKNLKSSLVQIEEEIFKEKLYEYNEKTFWTTAIGSEIESMMQDVFKYAEKEICLIPYVMDKEKQIESALLNVPNILKEIYSISKRGVKIRVIFPEEFAKAQMKNFEKMKLFDKIKKNIEIKILEKIHPDPFTLIDVNQIILRLSDPLEKEKIIAMVKITDKRLSIDLKRKFEEMWEIAKFIK